jgi:hypothetical protein
VPVQAGDYVLGVRAPTESVGELLRSLLSERVVVDAEPPGNLSVFLTLPEPGSPRPLHRLYEGHFRNLRTPSPLRVLEGLWHEFDGYDVRARRDRMLLDGTVLIQGGRAHILPTRARAPIADNERVWERDGFLMVDRRWVELDLNAGTVTVPDPGLDLDGAATELIRAGFEMRKGEDRPSGTYPIATWTSARLNQRPSDRAVMAVCQILDRTRHEGAQMVRAAAQLLEHLPVVGTTWTDGDGFREALCSPRLWPP